MRGALGSASPVVGYGAASSERMALEDEDVPASSCTGTRCSGTGCCTCGNWFWKFLRQQKKRKTRSCLRCWPLRVHPFLATSCTLLCMPIAVAPDAAHEARVAPRHRAKFLSKTTKGRCHGWRYASTRALHASICRSARLWKILRT